MANIHSSINHWKALYDRMEKLSIVRSSVPTTRFWYEGKFFRVWVSKGYCLKWPKIHAVSKPYCGIPEIAAISLVFESVALSPPLISILYDPNMQLTGICVKEVEIIEKADTRSVEFINFENQLKTLAEEWHLRRRPYRQLPMVCSFVPEAKGRRNIGVMDGRFVLLDIDPNCYSNDSRVNFISLSIERALHWLE